MTRNGPPVVAIIGGGFTGAAVTYHLDRQITDVAPRIIIIEPRFSLGGGLAYSTTDPAHRVNVPAVRMSLDPDEPSQFENWLAASDASPDDPEAWLPDGRSFPRRSVFARYVREQLAPAVSDGRIVHKRAKVIRALKSGERYVLHLSMGETINVDMVVIATTHPPPSPPAIFQKALAGNPRFIADATLPNALHAIGADDRVLIVGTGLTMADIVASLDQRGHRGAITAISRRGQISAEHPPTPIAGFGDFLHEPSRTARQLVCAIRRMLIEAAARDVPWQAVFDTLRFQGRGIWAALDTVERRRLVRHLRPFWDARRFRVAPQVQKVLESKKLEGTFEVIAGSIQSVGTEESAIVTSIRPRHRGGNMTRRVDAVVIATGPGHRDIFDAEPYLGWLEIDGLVRLDAVGLGLDTDQRGYAVGRNGVVQESLLIAGPLARGTFGELMGLPEVARYAVDLAGEIARWCASWSDRIDDARFRVAG
jgi:uncharacterized NAD(P)/FAD-binding protein YdhS